MNEQNNTINLAMSCNNNPKYLFYLSVCVQSLMDSSNPNLNYVLHLFINDWSSEEINYWKTFTSQFPNLLVKMFDSKNIVPQPKYINSRYSISAINRLYLPTILLSLKRVLYLDCDLFIRKDIQKIYKLKIGDNYLGVVKDEGLISLVENKSTDFLSKSQYFKDINWHQYVYDILKMKNHRNQFNSGMMLMNLEQMRKDSLTNQLIENYEKIKPIFADQCVLNKLCEGKVSFLPMRCNVMGSHKIELKYIEKIYREAIIVHKPWKHILLKEEFYNIAKKIHSKERKNE